MVGECNALTGLGLTRYANPATRVPHPLPRTWLNQPPRLDPKRPSATIPVAAHKRHTGLASRFRSRQANAACCVGCFIHGKAVLAGAWWESAMRSPARLRTGTPILPRACLIPQPHPAGGLSCVTAGETPCNKLTPSPPPPLQTAGPRTTRHPAPFVSYLPERSYPHYWQMPVPDDDFAANVAYGRECAGHLLQWLKDNQPYA